MLAWACGSAGTRYGAWLPASQQAGSGLGSSGVFGDLASAYDAARPAYPAQLFSDAKQLAPPGTRSADVGCGTGLLTVALAERGHTVTGADPSEGRAVGVGSDENAAPCLPLTRASKTRPIAHAVAPFA